MTNKYEQKNGLCSRLFRLSKASPKEILPAEIRKVQG